MPFKFLFGSDSSTMERVESQVHEMFVHDRREFHLAMSALLGDVAAGEVNTELRELDHKVNTLEREIRRALVVHATVRQQLDTPGLLVYMSIVKDVERVGDYAKNLLDLARDGARFGDLEDAAHWRDLAASVEAHIEQVGAAFLAHDDSHARRLIGPSTTFLQDFDRRVSALVTGADARPQAVARALAYRYIKRVVAHLLNVLSAVVMPVHKLDYFDEDPEDRQR
jgi:phosphate transport system protein